jgi:hypothetical protein
MTRYYQQKINLKINLIYVSSFHDLVILYRDEIRRMEKKIQSLSPELDFDLNRHQSTISRMSILFNSESSTNFSSSSYIEEFGIREEEIQSIKVEEVEEECSVWLCSCVNDLWRACKQHFIRKMNQSEKKSQSLTSLEAIDEDVDNADEEEFIVWDGVGFLSDEIRKTEREFSWTVQTGLTVLGNLFFFHVESILRLESLKQRWLAYLTEIVATPDPHSANPIDESLQIIDGYISRSEIWLEPVCFILLLEICSEIYIEKYLLMLKDIFESKPFILPVSKDQFIRQVFLIDFSITS